MRNARAGLSLVGWWSAGGETVRRLSIGSGIFFSFFFSCGYSALVGLLYSTLLYSTVIPGCMADWGVFGGGN